MDNRGKILILVPHLKGDGGVAHYYNNLKLETIYDIEYFEVNHHKPQSLFNTILRLTSKYIAFTTKLLVGEYYLVHVNPSLDYRSFYRDGLFVVISKIFNRKVLITFHGWLESYEQQIKSSKIKRFLFNRTYASADKFIVFGQHFKNKLLGMGVPNKSNFLVDTTVADSSFISEFNLETKISSYEKEVIFLFLSRILKSKGIYIALDAFQLFKKNNPERKACLIVAGDGPDLVEIKNYIHKNKINNVEFTGRVHGIEKKELLIKSHIMLLPSYTEGMPLSILEGMLYGMPLISRKIGAIPEVVKHGVNGFLSESLLANDYINYINSLALDADLYKMIAITNHQTALEKYATEKVRERVSKIYASFNN